LIIQVSVKFGISPLSKFLTNLVNSSLEMCEFSPFNQILLSLFEVSNMFYDNI